MRRHRFKGPVGQTCVWRAGSEDTARVCGLNYSASLHYNDDDHPYTDGQFTGSCVWQMQNVPGGPMFLLCDRKEEDAVHQHETAESEAGREPVTVSFEYPEQEPPVTWGKRDPDAGVVWPDGTFPPGVVPNPEARVVPDAPYEDGGPGDGSTWSALPPRPPAQKKGTPAWARWQLENSGELREGPWTVRQYEWGLGRTSVATGLLASLAETGDAFVMETWYVDSARQLVRITWGPLLNVDPGDLGPVVESWRV